MHLYAVSLTTQHKTLKVIYESSDTCGNLLLPSNKVSAHQRRLRFLMTEYIKAYSN